MDPIIALLPVDRAGLAALSGGRVAVPEPSIAHSLIRCEGCGTQCWIGPAQLSIKLARGLPAICYWCTARMLRGDPGRNLQLIALNPDADSIPRRG